MGARVGAHDAAVVARQLGRAPHPFERVVARCPWGRPAVIEDLPYDATGRPFPTLFWLTCPSAVAAVAALESRGGVGAFERRVAAEPALRRSLNDAIGYERRRRRDLARHHGLRGRDEGDCLRTGVGGVRDRARLKCLHAHAAHALARPRYALGAAIIEAAAPLWGEGDCCSRCEED